MINKLALLGALLCGTAHAQTYSYQFTGVAVEENGAKAVIATMPPHQVLYGSLTDCAGDGYLSAWVNSFPFLASGMQGAVAYACTPIQPTFGASNATMVITLVGTSPSRPIWQVGLLFATQTLCTKNIASLAAVQNFVSNFNWLSSLLPVPAALASTTMATQAQYQAPDAGGGTDNVTIACPPGGPA